MHLVHRKTCRVCGSPSLTKVIDLGEQHLQGSFVKAGKERPPLRKVPLRVVRCDPERDERACGLLQLEHTTPPDILYAAYWYRSGTNQTMRSHLADIAREAMDLAGRGGARVLDIGCNDGTLLAQYPHDYRKFGVDPSDVAQTVTGATVIQDVFPSRKLLEETRGERFGVITSIAMFYDLEAPVECARAIAHLLEPDGIWILEMSYMPTMLEMDSYDTICHEHLEYYSLAVLDRIMFEAGLRIFRISLNSINGGSIRVFVTHAANGKLGTPDDRRVLLERRQAEFELMLDTDEPYLAFQRRIGKHRDELGRLLRELKESGKRIHVYGASTKGNTILQWCGIDHTLIECAADRNPDKHGAATLGTNIPIVSEEESRSKRPDYYLVLPWHFRTEFLQREKAALESGVRMIFPLPKVEILPRQ
jgi:SAM-dependent methyltransferase